MGKRIGKAWMVMIALILIAPIGILATWNYGDAWGEWGEVQVGNNETWEPEQYGGAPLPDYNVAGWDSPLMASVGYWLSAIIGVSMCIFITLGVGKAVELWRKEEGPRDDGEK